MLMITLEAALEIFVVVVHLIQILVWGDRLAHPASFGSIFQQRVEGRALRSEFVGDRLQI